MTQTAEENPLLEGLRLGRRPEPCVIVIFGASGDLTHRKLFPALYSLAYRRLLPDEVGIVGIARTEQSTDAFCAAMRDAVKDHGRDPFRDDVWGPLEAGIRYIATDFADDSGLDELMRVAAELDEQRGTRGNRLYYLAVPPQAFTGIVDQLGERKDRDGDGWARLIVEKPFGRDLASAQELDERLHRFFREQELFRIDHYLGKETVQNMLALRFANGIFEPIWNRQFVDHVQITVAESMGIEGRGSYYEPAGAIRDIFQNHLLQLVAL
ncbi:MAG TPA: glucose-6-phosphate dehydrogenase, partial [Gaiellaceae bacterium]|nr:glucose-6-phosphate dehydrogenase [Gaiellaceae bacterium]